MAFITRLLLKIITLWKNFFSFSFFRNGLWAAQPFHYYSLTKVKILQLYLILKDLTIFKINLVQKSNLVVVIASVWSLFKLGLRLLNTA